MRQHSTYSYNMIKDRPEFSPAVCLGVLQHHEKINGSGYPMGVSAEKICPYAKILSVADIYDALVTERPYKKPIPREMLWNDYVHDHGTRHNCHEELP